MTVLCYNACTLGIISGAENIYLQERPFTEGSLCHQGVLQTNKVTYDLYM
jgi:hypothetical protein